MALEAQWYKESQMPPEKFKKAMYKEYHKPLYKLTWRQHTDSLDGVYNVRHVTENSFTLIYAVRYCNLIDKGKTTNYTYDRFGHNMSVQTVDNERGKVKDHFETWPLSQYWPAVVDQWQSNHERGSMQ